MPAATATMPPADQGSKGLPQAGLDPEWIWVVTALVAVGLLIAARYLRAQLENGSRR